MNDTFLIERYKYILDSKRDLNKSTFVVISIFQAMVVGVIGSAYAILVGFSDRKISVDVSRLGIWGLIAISVIVSVFCVSLILSGIFSWLKYRRDEADIELIVHGASRSSATWYDTMRWYETYVLITMFVIECAITLSLILFVIPLLSG